MSSVLVLADDFTGAMDTGHGFAARGCAVRVVVTDPNADDTDRPSSSDADVLAVDLDSRDLEPETAAAAVSSFLERGPVPEVVYKKVDSTLRGNVVREVDAALEATGAELAIVAPAFPGTGRVTANGRHLVDGRPLEDAGYGTDSDLPALFESSEYDVAILSLETILEGPDAVASALADRERDSPAIVVCDAVHDRHLEAIAAGARRCDREVLYVGSGGLASAVAVPDSSRSPPEANPEGEGALGIVGSVNDRTLEQLAAVSDRTIIELDPAAAVANPRETGRNAAADLESIRREYGRAVLTGATSRTNVDRASEAAAEHGIDAGPRVARALGVAAAEATRSVPPKGLLLTGGAIARAALEELSASAIDLTGEAVVDGIPEGVIGDGPAAGTPIVTKAGGFGDRRSIVNCLNFLDRVDERE
ncbi:ygbK domain-containing protein [Natronococcus amylolyticus DSM 10524]|uniref:YgbK domain-containing protein n=1 Tax=Natronococcus amylolyticus DSM 10524 TaxID=1227497 RepID=L9X475_9EURY|nr:four-carbon acid sugar kinase family protein [Natronococcus amylolyticus]ELY55398.1 ygbK domain-containing protein [Natronococcus amylolyticus DSM 10524]